MCLPRRVGFFAGLKYRGGATMLAWMLHRVTGVAMLVLITTHVIAGFFMQQMDSQVAAAVNTIYESWGFQALITFIVMFHAFNGLRIAVLDIWPQLQVYQRQALWIQLLIFLSLYGVTAGALIQRAFAGG
jgi:succinate dehydrogenase / fumarate reductase cytochrome b subunit